MLVPREPVSLMVSGSGDIVCYGSENEDGDSPARLLPGRGSPKCNNDCEMWLEERKYIKGFIEQYERRRARGVRGFLHFQLLAPIGIEWNGTL